MIPAGQSGSAEFGAQLVCTDCINEWMHEWMNEIGDSLKRNGLLIWLGRMDAIFVAEEYIKKRGIAWPTVFMMMGISVDWNEGEGNGTKVLLREGEEEKWRKILAQV